MLTLAATDQLLNLSVMFYNDYIQASDFHDDPKDSREKSVP